MKFMASSNFQGQESNIGNENRFLFHTFLTDIRSCVQSAGSALSPVSFSETRNTPTQVDECVSVDFGFISVSQGYTSRVLIGHTCMVLPLSWNYSKIALVVPDRILKPLSQTHSPKPSDCKYIYMSSHTTAPLLLKEFTWRKFKTDSCLNFCLPALLKKSCEQVSKKSALNPERLRHIHF